MKRLLALFLSLVLMLGAVVPAYATGDGNFDGGGGGMGVAHPPTTGIRVWTVSAFPW